MSFQDFVFDARAFAPEQGFPVIPADKYRVNISTTSLKQTKDQTGAMFQVEYTIAEGPYAGVKLFDRFNLWNSNADAVRIAQGQLSALCWVTGIQQVSMRDEGASLRGAPLVVEVSVRESKEYGKQNDVKKRLDMYGNEPGKGGGQPAGAPSGMPPAGMGAPAGAPAAAPQGQWAGGPGPAPQPATQPAPQPGPASWGAGGGNAAGAAPMGAPGQPGGPAWGGQPAPQPAPQPQPAPAGPAWGGQQAGPAPAGPAWGNR